MINDNYERNFLKSHCTYDWIMSFDADEQLINPKEFFYAAVGKKYMEAYKQNQTQVKTNAQKANNFHAGTAKPVQNRKTQDFSNVSDKELEKLKNDEILRQYGHTVVEVIFDNKDFDNRIIAATVKEAKEKDDIVPDMGSIKFRMFESVTDDTQRKYIIQQLAKIQEASSFDSLKVQDIAMKFCKQQELKKSIKQIQKIIDIGDIENYEQCETILRKALEHGDNKDDGMDIFDNIENVLVDDFRKPIRTGIKGLDEVMDGGLSKGELAVILAPFGVGKTTMITKLANTAVNDGKIGRAHV